MIHRAPWTPCQKRTNGTHMAPEKHKRSVNGFQGPYFHGQNGHGMGEFSSHQRKVRQCLIYAVMVTLGHAQLGTKCWWKQSPRCAEVATLTADPSCSF